MATCLTITGIIDATLSGGLPKGLELFANCGVADASVYGIGAHASCAGRSSTDAFESPYPAAHL